MAFKPLRAALARPWRGGGMMAAATITGTLAATVCIAAKYRRISSGRSSMNGRAATGAGNKRQGGGDL
jgi:hypothetical protein